MIASGVSATVCDQIRSLIRIPSAATLRIVSVPGNSLVNFTTLPLTSSLIVNTSYDKSSAVVVLPAVGGGRLQNKSLHAWLARSELTVESGQRVLLARVLKVLGVSCPEHGLAALRMWGQTGDRPTHWIAAADAIYLEPRLDHLFLHALRRGGVPAGQMRALIDHLQSTLASTSQDNAKIGFVRLGSYCYLSATSPIATATVPAYVVDQQPPNEFLPSGDTSATHRNLIGEIEMALHEHEVNQRREESGQQPVNSLWLWGGGTAPEQKTRPQPPLFSDDPLLTGFWYSGTGLAEPWLGSIAACIEESIAGFVAETPEFDDDPDLLEGCLHELQSALASGRLSKVTILFRDGIRADIKRSDALRFWRRNSGLISQ